MCSRPPEERERRLDWSERILEFPVRTAAVDAFLSELKTKRSADLNGVLVTLNDGALCRLALSHWLSAGWIVVAPHSPLVAMAGPTLTPDLTLRVFCGEAAPTEAESPEEELPQAPTESSTPSDATKESTE